MIPALIALAARALPMLAEAGAGAEAATAATAARTAATAASRTSAFTSGATKYAAGNYVADKLSGSEKAEDKGGGNPYATRTQPV